MLHPLDALDTGAVARALALVSGGSDEIADVFYERTNVRELVEGADECGDRERNERGLAVRLVRGGRSWLSARDDDSPAALQESLRAVARALPPALPSPLPLPPEEKSEAATEAAHAADDALRSFSGWLERALRKKLVAFPYRLAVRRYERAARIVTARTASFTERESFASVEVEFEWGRCGELATNLDDELAERVAERLAARFGGREAKPPASGHPTLLFSASAAAVALHEAVAHALEADLLARGGNPAASDGVLLGGASLDILDDPSSAPEAVRRTVDDEGVPTARRWLVRAGRVAQPIADLRHSRRFGDLLAGSGFRSGRHSAPLPRTFHLELVAGEANGAQLLAEAEGGIAVHEIESGSLDAAAGRFTLVAAGGRRVSGGALGEPIGRFTIRGKIAGLLGGIVATGARRESAGAGWCAKEGQRRAVWATVPSIVVAGLEVGT